MANETAAEIAQHFTAMGHCVDVITKLIDGSHLTGLPNAEKQLAVDQGVEHLELMKTRDFWTSEDFTAVDAAIVSGKAYTP
jgi:hypothetical protein